MSDVFAKEKLLYESVTSKTNDRDFIISLRSYIEFILTDGLNLMKDNLAISAIERRTESDEIENLSKNILNNVAVLMENIGHIVKKDNLQENPTLRDDISQVNNYLNGNAQVFNAEFFDMLYGNCEDVLSKLISLGFEQEIAKYARIENSRIREIIALEKRKEYYSKRNAFNMKDVRRLAGSFFRLTDLYRVIHKYEDPNIVFPKIDLGNFIEVHTEKSSEKEYEDLMMGKISSGVHFSKEKFAMDAEIIHNEIVLNSTTKDNSTDQIFYIKDGKIYHYENGIMNYKLKGVKEPKFIKMFKNIITYMPSDKNKIRISELEKRINKLDKCGIEYRSNIGKNAKSFNNFLKQNGIPNVHPKTKSPVISATDEYVIFNNKI